MTLVHDPIARLCPRIGCTGQHARASDGLCFECGMIVIKPDDVSTFSKPCWSAIVVAVMKEHKLTQTQAIQWLHAKRCVSA